jgi:branched-chain amino acid transport system permease protein
MINYLHWLYWWFKNEVLNIPGRLIAFVFLISLFLLPLFYPNHVFILRILTITGIFAIFAASWDLLAGFTGQLNLGHALFFGVAAYSSALLNKHFGLPPLVTIPIGSIAGIVVGLIAGLPALQLRGFYLALVTLSFPTILIGIIFAFPDFTGGEFGIYGLDSLSSSPISTYYIVNLVMVCTLLAMYKLTDGESKIIRTGIIFHAIREDEITTRASGINTANYKLLAFSVSGFFAGIAGGLFTHFIKISGPSNLELFFSFQVILWTVFGGMRTIYGPVAGVYILYPLIELLRLHPLGERIRFILFALLLIFTLLFMPEGFTIWIRDKIEIKCQRCKLINIATRHFCRACRAPLHLERNESIDNSYKKEGNGNEIHI